MPINGCWIVPRRRRFPAAVICGASEALLDVWAVQVNLTLGTQTEATEENPANALPVRCNVDDDNGDWNIDLLESLGPDGPGVSGEDDLAALGMEVLPREAPAGTLTLSLPANGAIEAYAEADKTGGVLATLSWSVVSRATPKTCYLEGIEGCDAQTFTLTYTWGDVTVQDTALAKVVSARPSGASLRMYQADSYWWVTGGPKGGQEKIGGNTLVALTMTLAPRTADDKITHVAATSARVRFADSYDQELLCGYFQVPLDTPSGWYVVTPGVSPNFWPPAEHSPAFGNNTFKPITLAYKIRWKSPEEPYLSPYSPHIGHNGRHYVWIDQVDGYDVTTIPFQVGNTNAVWRRPQPGCCPTCAIWSSPSWIRITARWITSRTIRNRAASTTIR